jgi:DNA-binding CsgD family transcriptional regulator
MKKASTKLTSLQCELLKLLALDHTALEAGELLGLNPQKTRWHCIEVKRKLKTRTLLRAVLKYMINP